MYRNPARAARKAKEWAFGVNWYPERRIKFAINYGQTSFDRVRLEAPTGKTRKHC